MRPGVSNQHAMVPVDEKPSRRPKLMGPAISNQHAMVPVDEKPSRRPKLMGPAISNQHAMVPVDEKPSRRPKLMGPARARDEMVLWCVNGRCAGSITFSHRVLQSIYRSRE